MPVGDVLQVTFVMQAGSQQVGLNVRHYNIVTSVGGAVVMPGWADEFFNQFGALYLALLSTQAVFHGVHVSRIHPMPPGMPSQSSQLPASGLVAGDLLPRQVAGLISLRTDLAGRAFRGRSYIPFPSEADNEADSSPTVQYLTRLGQLATEYLQPVQVTDGVATETAVPIIWHRATRTFHFITSAMVNDAWATQRRRGSFGRPNMVPGQGVQIEPEVTGLELQGQEMKRPRVFLRTPRSVPPAEVISKSDGSKR